MRAMAFGAAANWVAFAAILAVSFFLTPVLLAKLGTARYDVWCVAEAVLAYVTLLDLGIAVCLVRHVAKGRHDPDSLSRIASSCLATYAGAALLALVVGVPIMLMLAPRLTAKADDALPFLLVMLANVALTLPLSVFASLLDGLERFAAKSLIRIAVLAVRTVAILAVAEDGLLPLALVLLAANLLEHIAFAVCVRRDLPAMRLDLRLVDRATLRLVRTSSVDAFLAMLAGRVSVQTGAIVLGLLLPAGGVTAFATAARLVEYAKTLLRTVTATLTPGVAAMEAAGNADGIRTLFLGVTRWVLYVALPVNLGLWFFGRAFLTRWVGETVATNATPTLAILALTLTLGVAQSVASRILYGLGRLRLFARLALVEAALHLVLLAALAVPFGVEGVAVAVAVPNLLFCAAVLAFTVRTLGVSPGDYLAAWAWPLALNVVPFAVWQFAAAEPTWPSLVRTVLLGLLPYAACVTGHSIWSENRGGRVSDAPPPALRTCTMSPATEADA